MLSFATSHPALVDVVWPQKSVTRNLLLVYAGAMALAVSAWVQFPLVPASLFPVPITMQTFVVLSLGAAFGWRLAAITLLLYLGVGALGLPVFSGGAGGSGYGGDWSAYTSCRHVVSSV